MAGRLQGARITIRTVAKMGRRWDPKRLCYIGGETPETRPRRDWVGTGIFVALGIYLVLCVVLLNMR
jgi:hypothetical protein